MVTNTTTDKAEQYLTLADGNVDQAVTLFFENGGADLISTAPATQSTSPPRPSAPGNSRDPINIDADNVSDDDDPQITGVRRVGGLKGPASYGGSSFDDDAAMAQRLQEEMYRHSGGLGGGGDEPVRAPIARQAETLMGADTEIGIPDSAIPAAVQQRMRDFQWRQMRGLV